MKMEITWTIIMLAALLHGTLSDSADPNSQSGPANSEPQFNTSVPSTHIVPADPTPQTSTLPPSHPDPSLQTSPAQPSTQTNPANPSLQTNPAQPSTQTNPANPSLRTNPAQPSTQTNPANPSLRTNPAQPSTQTTPTNPSLQTNPAQPSTQTNPANPSLQTNPAQPSTQTNPANPSLQTNPAQPSTQTNPTNPSLQTNPAQPSTQTNPTNPSLQTNPAQPSTQTNPANPSLQTNPAQPSTQTNPANPSLQTNPATKPTNLLDPFKGRNAESLSSTVPDSLPTVSQGFQTLEAQTTTTSVTSNPQQTDYKLTPETQDETKKSFTRDFDLSTNSEGDVLFETCKMLGQKVKGNCSVIMNIIGKQLFATVIINADRYIQEELYKPSTNSEQKENTIKETIPDTLIAILASCGALVLILCFFAAYCTYHRRSYRKNQQHLTEELQTVENGYHDNPTLEVMEVQPEMQEKKLALNGEFNDSWIVPIDNLLKEDIPDEEDTHL